MKLENLDALLNGLEDTLDVPLLDPLAMLTSTKGLDEEDTNPTGFRYLLIAIAMKRAKATALPSS